MRSLQDANQSYIKYTENALLIHNNNNNNSNNVIIIIIIVVNSDDDFKNEEKVQLQIDKKTSYIFKESYYKATAIIQDSLTTEITF